MSDIPQYQHLRIDRDDSILIMTIDRPHKLNALTPRMHDDLLALLAAADADRDSRVLVLTGAGRAFCTGGDMSRKRDHGDTEAGDSDPKRVIYFAQRLVSTLLSIQKPIIAMVNGYAIGLGASITLFCDMVTMATDAQIGDRHINVGLLPGDGGSVIWPVLIGPARAKEMLLTGRLLNGVEAHTLGLVNHAAPPDELYRTTMDLAREVAAQPEYAVRATKFAINRHIRQATENVMDLSINMEMISMSRPEHHEALERFNSRRRGQQAGGGRS